MRASPEVYAARLDLARAALRAADLDALLLAPGADLTYLTGFNVYIGERLLALVLPRDGAPRWIAPALNLTQLQDHGIADEALHVWDDATGAAPATRAALNGLTRVAIDEEMRAGFALDLREWRPDACLARAGAVMRGLRIRKDDAEIAALRESAAVVDRVVPEVHAACRVGRREREVATEIRAALERVSPGFEPWGVVVASGPNGALPHHETGERRLETGDVVVVDYGGYPGGELNGYVSDITLTLCLGKPATEARRIYTAVWDAQQRAIDAIRPGVTGGAVDAAARQSLTHAGYADRFVHRTGHGVGLSVHEPPDIVAGSKELLEEGVCFSVEPGVYLPGRLGVRLEVLVTVTGDGVSLLNEPSAREPAVLPA